MLTAFCLTTRLSRKSAIGVLLALWQTPAYW
jgi:hypothetical protein